MQRSVIYLITIAIFLFIVLLFPSETFAAFTRNLARSSQGPDVKQLQETLNKLGFTVAQSGNGSPGQETEYFGPRTEAAVKSFQAQYGVVNINTQAVAGYGMVGPKTRSELDRVSVSSGSGVVSGIVQTHDGLTESIVIPNWSGSAAEFLRKSQSDPFNFLTQSQRDRIIKKRFILIPKKNLSQNETARLKRLAESIGGKIFSDLSYPKRGTFSFQLPPSVSPQILQNDSLVERLAPDRFFFPSGNDPQFSDSTKLAFSDTNTVNSSASASTPVTVGVVDTGVDYLPSGSLSGTASYTIGPDVSRLLTFSQTWHSSRTFPVVAPKEGGWLNVTASFFPNSFHLFDPIADLDLYLWDGERLLAAAETNGFISPSERIEIFLPPQQSEKILKAEVRPKSNTSRVQGVKYVGGYSAFPTFAPLVEASLFPKQLNVSLTETVTNQPSGALPSHTGVWKIGTFSLHGKQYKVALSDVYPDKLCITERPSATWTREIYVFAGFDGASFDLNGDGNFNDAVGVGRCDPVAATYGYVAPSFSINGVTYLLSQFYSMYVLDLFTGGSVQYPKTKIPFLTSLNNSVAGFEKIQAGDIYGPLNATEDFLGHGTHVGGIVHNTVPNAMIYSAKVFGALEPLFGGCWSNNSRNESLDGIGVSCSSGIGASESDIINGIDGAIKNGAKVINLSISALYSPPDTCDDFLMNQYIKSIVAKGITVVVAAGNAGPNSKTIGAPGCLEEVITVGAVGTTQPPTVTRYSSRGPTNEGKQKPDLLAIGGDDSREVISPEHTISLFPEGVSSLESRHLWSYLGVTDRVGVDQIKMSGTSMATPQVAGAVALLLGQDPTLSPAQIKKILTETAKNLGLPKETQGAGLLDIEKALAQIGGAPPPPPPPPPPTTTPTFVLTPPSAVVKVGETQQFTGLYDSDGPDGPSTNITPTSTSIIWSSSNNSAATINTSGLTTGIASGTVTINGIYEGIAATANLAVISATSTPPSTATGTIKIKRVDVNDQSFVMPTTAYIDAITSTANPYSVTNKDVAVSHITSVDGIVGYTISYGTCTVTGTTNGDCMPTSFPGTVQAYSIPANAIPAGGTYVVAYKFTALSSVSPPSPPSPPSSVDFSLSTSGDKSITQESAVQNSVVATLISGPLPQNVSLSVSGLPSAASASFSASTCLMTCSATLTISTTASTPIGTYAITVTGTGSGGISRTTQFNLTVNSRTSISPPSATTGAIKIKRVNSDNTLFATSTTAYIDGVSSITNPYSAVSKDTTVNHIINIDVPNGYVMSFGICTVHNSIDADCLPASFPYQTTSITIGPNTISVGGTYEIVFKFTRFQSSVSGNDSEAIASILFSLRSLIEGLSREITKLSR